MKRILKTLSCLLMIMVVAFTGTVGTFAEDANVIYSGNSGEFIFAPGSDYSPTDLFANFKDVMPGASLEQKITLRNDADKKVKVVIYLRSFGEIEGSSEDFLNQLKLTVKKASDTTLFEAAANEPAQLTEWTEIGTLHSGGKVDLNLVLSVPTTLDNKYQNQIGKIKWQFMAVEYPAEDNPDTGDTQNALLWIIILAACAVVIVILILVLLKRRKKDKDDTKAE